MGPFWMPAQWEAGGGIRRVLFVAGIDSHARSWIFAFLAPLIGWFGSSNGFGPRVGLRSAAFGRLPHHAYCLYIEGFGPRRCHFLRIKLLAGRNLGL